MLNHRGGPHNSASLASNSPWNEPVLRGRADGEGEGRVGVAVAVAVVVVPAPVARRPHEDAALAPPARAHALHEGPRRQPAGAVHRLAVVVGAPTEKGQWIM